MTPLYVIPAKRSASQNPARRAGHDLLPGSLDAAGVTFFRSNDI